MGQCCDRCQVCNSCNNPSKGTKYLCNVPQTYCSPQPETANGNLFMGPNAPTFQRDDIIFKEMPRSELNRWIQWVIDASKYKSGTNGEDIGNKSSPQQSANPEDRDFVYADKINELIKIMTGVSSKNNPGLIFKRDDIIKAEDFNKITEKLNNFMLAHSGCPECVAACNVNCNNCNTCITCQSCTTCCTCD